MSILTFPDAPILPPPSTDRLVADAERDIHGACASLMLLAADLNTVDQVLEVSRKLIAMRAALDSASSMILQRGDDLTERLR